MSRSTFHRAPDLLGWVEEHRQVEARPRQAAVKGQEPFHDHVARRREQHWAVERAVVVVVDGLENRLAHRQQLQVLLHDPHVVARGVEGGEGQPLALDAVVAVVVVDAHGAHPGAERGDEPAGQGGLARRAVAGDRQHDRPAGSLAAEAADGARLRAHGARSNGPSTADRRGGRGAAAAEGMGGEATNASRVRPPPTG